MTTPTAPVFERALSTARAAYDRAKSQWAKVTRTEGIDRDVAEEVLDHARAALEHLEEGRFDDARGAADVCLELDEIEGDGEVWREFALLVEEAAETGIALL